MDIRRVRPNDKMFFSTKKENFSKKEILIAKLFCNLVDKTLSRHDIRPQRHISGYRFLTVKNTPLVLSASFASVSSSYDTMTFGIRGQKEQWDKLSAKRGTGSAPPPLSP